MIKPRKRLTGILLVLCLFFVLGWTLLKIPMVNSYVINNVLSYVVSSEEMDYQFAVSGISFRWDGFSVDDFLLLKSNRQDTLVYAKRLDCIANFKSMISSWKFSPERINFYDVLIYVDSSLFIDSVPSVNLQEMLPISLKAISSTRTRLVLKHKLATLSAKISYAKWDNVHYLQLENRNKLSSLILESPSIQMLSYPEGVEGLTTLPDTFVKCSDTTSVLSNLFAEASRLLSSEGKKLLLPIYPLNLRIDNLSIYNRTDVDFPHIPYAFFRYQPQYTSNEGESLRLESRVKYKGNTLQLKVHQAGENDPVLVYDAEYAQSYIRANAAIKEDGNLLDITSVSMLLVREDVNDFLPVDTTLAALWSSPLLFEGDIELSSELLQCRIDSMLFLDNFSARGRITYTDCQRRLLIDSMEFSLPTNFLEIVNRYTPTLQLDSMLYIPQLSKVYMEGSIHNDTLYNVLLSSDRIHLASSDSMWRDISLKDYSLHLVKDTNTNFRIKADQHIAQLTTLGGNYDNFNMSYLQGKTEERYDSVSISIERQNSFGSIKLYSLFRRHMDGNITAFMDGEMDKIPISDFLKVDLLSNTNVKTSFGGQIQWRGNGLLIGADFHDLLVVKGDRSLVIPQFSVSSQWSKYEAYVEASAGKDYFYASYDKLSLQDIVDCIVYQYESVVDDEEHSQGTTLSFAEGAHAKMSCSIQSLHSWMYLFDIPSIDVGTLDFDMILAGYDMKADMRIAEGKYDEYSFSNLHSRWSGSESSVFLFVDIDSVYGDRKVASHINVDIATEDRENVQFSLLGILTSEDEKLDVQGSIHSTSTGGMYLAIKTFDVPIDGSRWVLADVDETPDGTLSNLLERPSEFTITNGTQLLSCFLTYYKWQRILDVQLHTSNMDIDIFNKLLFEPSFVVGGNAFLDIAVQGKIDNLVTSLGGRISELSFNGTPLGDVDVYQQYKNSKMQLSVYDRYGSDLRMKSFIDFSSSMSYTMYLSVHNKPLSWLNYYIVPSMHEVGGRCSGDVELRYDAATDMLSIDGTADVIEGEGIVSYTNCKYVVEKGLVEFDGQHIKLDNWKIRTSERPTLSGQLTLDMEQVSSFGLLDMDLQLTTDNLKLYDGKIQGQENYRLHLYAGGGLILRKRNNLMDVFGNLSVSDSSVFEIRTFEDKGDVFDYHQITIRDAAQQGGGEKMKVQQNYYDALLKSIEKEEEINFSSEIDINDNLRAYFYTDVNSQESINFLGDGHLSVNSYDKKTVEIVGEYNILDITPFDIGSLPIELDKRSPSVIRWSGDPNPDLDVYVRSFMKSVDFSSLYNSVGTLVDDNLNTTANTNSRELRSDVELDIHVHGTASNINPQFDLQLPASSNLQNSQNVRLFLDGFRSDPQFAKQQVGHLVLFNRLTNRTELAQSEINVNSAIVGALSSITTYVLNESIGADLVQKTIDKVLPGRNIRFNINSNFSSTSNGLSATTNNQEGTALIDKGNISLLLSKGFFSDRLVLSVGSAFNYFINATNESAQSTSNTQFYTSPSVDLRWQIAPASNVYLGLYYKNTVDLDNQLVGVSTQQTSNITGVNIGFQKEVDSFRELFTRNVNVAERRTKDRSRARKRNRRKSVTHKPNQR